VIKNLTYAIVAATSAAFLSTANLYASASQGDNNAEEERRPSSAPAVRLAMTIAENDEANVEQVTAQLRLLKQMETHSGASEATARMQATYAGVIDTLVSKMKRPVFRALDDAKEVVQKDELTLGKIRAQFALLEKVQTEHGASKDFQINADCYATIKEQLGEKERGLLQATLVRGEALSRSASAPGPVESLLEELKTFTEDYMCVSVCVYKCECVYVYVCICVCMCVYVYVCVCVCMCV